MDSKQWITYKEPKFYINLAISQIESQEIFNKLVRIYDHLYGKGQYKHSITHIDGQIYCRFNLE